MTQKKFWKKKFIRHFKGPSSDDIWKFKTLKIQSHTCYSYCSSICRWSIDWPTLLKDENDKHIIILLSPLLLVLVTVTKRLDLVILHTQASAGVLPGKYRIQRYKKRVTRMTPSVLIFWPEGAKGAFNLPRRQRLRTQGTARGHRFTWLLPRLFHKIVILYDLPNFS